MVYPPASISPPKPQPVQATSPRGYNPASLPPMPSPSPRSPRGVPLPLSRTASPAPSAFSQGSSAPSPSFARAGLPPPSPSFQSFRTPSPAGSRQGSMDWRSGPAAEGHAPEPERRPGERRGSASSSNGDFRRPSAGSLPSPLSSPLGENGPYLWAPTPVAATSTQGFDGFLHPGGPRAAPSVPLLPPLPPMSPFNPDKRRSADMMGMPSVPASPKPSTPPLSPKMIGSPVLQPLSPLSPHGLPPWATGPPPRPAPSPPVSSPPPPTPEVVLSTSPPPLNLLPHGSLSSAPPSPRNSFIPTLGVVLEDERDELPHPPPPRRTPATLMPPPASPNARVTIFEDNSELSYFRSSVFVADDRPETMLASPSAPPPPGLPAIKPSPPLSPPKILPPSPSLKSTAPLSPHRTPPERPPRPETEYLGYLAGSPPQSPTSQPPLPSPPPVPRVPPPRPPRPETEYLGYLADSPPPLPAAPLPPVPPPPPPVPRSEPTPTPSPRPETEYLGYLAASPPSSPPPPLPKPVEVPTAPHNLGPPDDSEDGHDYSLQEVEDMWRDEANFLLEYGIDLDLDHDPDSLDASISRHSLYPDGHVAGLGLALAGMGLGQHQQSASTADTPAARAEARAALMRRKTTRDSRMQEIIDFTSPPPSFSGHGDAPAPWPGSLPPAAQSTEQDWIYSAYESSSPGWSESGWGSAQRHGVPHDGVEAGVGRAM